MGGFFALVSTLGVGVIVASIIYQVLSHPAGTKTAEAGPVSIVNSTVSKLFS